MTRVLEAVYEGGVFRPLVDPGLTEHQRVFVEIRLPSETQADGELENWLAVYAGLSESEIAEVEAVTLDRSHFSRDA